jgi:hypothetical protein
MPVDTPPPADDYASFSAFDFHLRWLPRQPEADFQLFAAADYTPTFSLSNTPIFATPAISTAADYFADINIFSFH